MRTYLLAALLLISFCGWGQSVTRTKKYIAIKRMLVDVNNDDISDTIVLSSSLKERSFFNKISVSITGYNKQTFYAKDQWTVVDKSFLDSNKNSVSSKLVFFKKTDKHAVILLFGILDDAGYRSEFSIINIEENACKMVFDQGDDALDVEVPVKLTDLQADGRLCFVYTTIFEYDGFSSKASVKKGKPDLGAYHPYWVYPIDNECKLNKPLSKKYMEDHYVFAGYDYSEKINILYPTNGGKPRIWRKKPIQPDN